MIIVIPSNREIQLSYFEPLIDAGANFIVVDDSEGNIKLKHPQFEVFNWNDRKRILGELDNGFPRRNGACRDFGFYLAWQRAEPDEIILAIDDDCQIDMPDFYQKLHHVFQPKLLPTVDLAGDHFNILDLYKNTETPQLYPRGFPYSARSDYIPGSFVEEEHCTIDFNLGLWKNVFDINAIDKIKLDKWSFPDAELHYEQVAIPKDILISVCSMNMQFRAKLIPIVYQLPMHVEVAPGWVIDRYGDIWGGFILKMLMDIKGDRMSAGGPMIRHIKEGDFLRNIWQEHYCHLVNNEFIELLQECTEVVKPASYIDMFAHLGEEIALRASRCSEILNPYLIHLVYSMNCWIKALRK